VDMLFNVLIISGVCVLFCGLNFKAIRIPKNSETKNLENLFARIESNRIIKKLMELLTLSRNSWYNRFEVRILGLSEVGIDLKRLYLIKLLCIVACMVVLITVRTTNMGYEAKLIIEDSHIRQTAFYNEGTSAGSLYEFFNMVLSKMEVNKLKKADPAGQFEIVEDAVSQCTNSTDKQLIEEKTQWFLDKWRESQSIRFFKAQYVLIIFLALFLPDVFLILRWLVKGALYKKEIIKLEYIFELLARIDGIKTLDIIHELEKSSKTYSKWLNQFGAIFKYDKKRGFNYLHQKNVRSLSKLTDIMEIYSLTDKEIALQILEREVMERDESMIMAAEETLDFIDLIAFMSIVPLVYELARLMLNPMLDIVYRAFEFI
jgi:hypothetical protein